MWLPEDIKKRKKFKRIGLLKTLVLPKLSDLEDKKNDIKINTKTKSIEVVLGKHVYALTNEFGVSELSEFSLFFIDDYVVVELQKGCLYLKEGSDKIVILDSKNRKSEYLNDRDKIYWKTSLELLNYCRSMTAHKFNLVKEKEIADYTSNLIFTFKSSYDLNQGKLYTLKLEDYYYDLGIDKFKYEKKEKLVDTKVIELKEKSSFKEEDLSETTEVEKLKAIKKRNTKALSDSIDEDDEDIEEIEMLPYMHEVDIFNDYASETPDTF